MNAEKHSLFLSCCLKSLNHNPSAACLAGMPLYLVSYYPKVINPQLLGDDIEQLMGCIYYPKVINPQLVFEIDAIKDGCI